MERESLLAVPTALALLLACLAVAVGVFLGLRLARTVLRRRIARTRRLGRRGARRAFALLEAAGYRVLGTEVVGEGRLEVNGREEAFRVRADALARRHGRVFVVEGKGGPEAGEVTNRATRRQLLEYAFVFGAEGVLLVDADRGLVRVVRFPGLPVPVDGPRTLASTSTPTGQ